MPLHIVMAVVLSGVASPDGTAWTAKDVPHDVGALYALSWHATPRGPGLLNGGPPKYNMDFPVKAGETNEQFLSVVYPAEATSLSLRLGTWEMPGGASWRDASCRRVLAEYNALPCGIVLGAGEAIDGNVYRFRRRNCKIRARMCARSGDAPEAASIPACGASIPEQDATTSSR